MHDRDTITTQSDQIASSGDTIGLFVAVVLIATAMLPLALVLTHMDKIDDLVRAIQGR